VTPLPEHLLSRTYAQDKAKVADLPYWGGDFVGSGPFRVREFIPGNHIVLDANDQYVLGRPRLDQVEVKFIADVNAMLSNVLSGTVDATMGRGLSPDDAIRTRDRWTAGKMEGQMLFIVVVFPQFINTNPPIITNVQFRRALLTAIDRQQMVDTLQRGLSPVADSFLSPANPTYDATISAAVRYPYDPQRASQMLADLGYRKDADGGLRDTAGQPLAVEIRVGANSNLQVQSTQAVAEYWRAVGVGVSTVSIPPQQAADNDYIYTFPAFHLQQHPSRVDVLANFGSANTYYPEARSKVSGNVSRYQSPEFDALVDRLQLTVPKAERTQVLSDVIHLISDQLPQMPLFYQVEPMLIANRIHGMGGRAVGSTAAWNASQWDVEGS
jgi:peptide/nickel transport system substrate-binding protein